MNIPLALAMMKSVPKWVWSIPVLVALALVLSALHWYGSQPESRAVQGHIFARAAYATVDDGDESASEFSYLPRWNHTFFIGDQEQAVQEDMYVEFSGLIALSSIPEDGQPFDSPISGTATSVRFNNEQQLPARWGLVEQLPSLLVTTVLTTLATGIVGVAIGFFAGQRQRQS